MTKILQLCSIALIGITLASCDGHATHRNGDASSITQRKTLTELINRDDPGWPIVQEWIGNAKNHVEVLPIKNDKSREEALLATQVTTRSPMGAIVYETGGILIDHGWLRILGSGSTKITRSLPTWNRSATGKSIDRTTPFVLIADDVLGGFYALDGGGLGAPGRVFYLAPDSLAWENMNLGYSDFIDGFCFNGDLEKFYKPHRWSNWQKEIAAMNGDQTLSIYPPLWSKTDESIAQRTRRPVPVLEGYHFLLESAKQLEGVPNGAQVEVRVTE